MANSLYSDLELVKLYKETGEYKFLTDLFARHSDVLYRNALRKLNNHATVEDVMQNAYCKMIRDLPKFNGTGSIIGWMVRLVILTAYEQIRSEKNRLNRERKYMSERITPSKSNTDGLSELLEAQLNKLPEIYKAPIMLQYIDGLSVKEVSEILELPEKTIRTQISRGLEKLKQTLNTVGYSLNSVGIVALLNDLQKPSAPPYLKSETFYNNILNTIRLSKESARLSPILKNNQLIKNFFYLISLTIGLGLFIYLLPYKNSTTATTPIDLTASKNQTIKQKLSKKWDFEDNSYTKDFKLKVGEILTRNGIGEDESNCLQFGKETMVEIDISNLEFPLKISFSFDQKIKGLKNNKGFNFFRANYENNQNVYIFTNLSTMSKYNGTNGNEKEGYVGHWVKAEVYLTPDSIDLWTNGKKRTLSLSKPIIGGNIYFYLFDYTIIDNFRIESIDIKRVPSNNKYRDYISENLFENKVESYMVDLKNKVPPLNLDSNIFAKLIIWRTENINEVLNVTMHERSIDK